MRRVLESIGTPEHVGLAYDAWAPVGDDGKVPDDKRARWLRELAGSAVSPDYRVAFARWKKSFVAPGDRTFELTLAGRLLIGHGNTSATDVGLTLHHTWGVPIIPGTALKGLLAHYVDAVYGPEHPDLAPWEQPEAERERARYQGITWHRRRIRRGPGEVYRALFGAPDADEDPVLREHGLEAGARAGLVRFHDALYVPQSTKDDRPFAADVLTVHQKTYYDTSGANWPNDYDNPNPVAFLTVRPGARFLVALSGPEDWTKLAERLLCDALAQWGVGGKTSSGYGRFAAPGAKITARVAPPKPGERVEAILLKEKTRRGGWKARYEPSGLAGHIQNPQDVPDTVKPGDCLTLIVASVNENKKEIDFKYPTPEKERAQQAAKKPKDHPRKPPPRGRR